MKKLILIVSLLSLSSCFKFNGSKDSGEPPAGPDAGIKFSRASGVCRNKLRVKMSQKPGQLGECANFRGQDLTKRDFSNQNLRGADFTGAILAEANFAGAQLHGANFRDSVLLMTNFKDAFFSKNTYLPFLGDITALKERDDAGKYNEKIEAVEKKFGLKFVSYENADKDLAESIRFGAKDRVEKLLSLDASPLAEDNGMTNFQIALDQDTEMFDLLLEHSVLADNQKDFVSQFLENQIRGKKHKNLGYLIKKGANVNVRLVGPTSPLAIAVESDDSKSVDLLLKAKADPNFFYGLCENLTSRVQSAEMLEVLAAHHLQWTKISSNCSSGCAQVVTLFSDATAWEKDQARKASFLSVYKKIGLNPQTPVTCDGKSDTLSAFVVSKSNSIPSIRHLIEMGMDPNAKSFSGESIYEILINRYLAESREDAQLLALTDLLVAKGAKVNVVDSSGRPLLHQIIKTYGSSNSDRLRTVLLRMIDHKVDLNSKDAEGNSILYYATEKNLDLEIFVRAGLDLYQRNSEGEPFWIRCKDVQCLTRLKTKYGINLNLTSTKAPNATFFQMWAKYLTLDFVLSNLDALTRLGLDPKVLDGQGKDLLEYVLQGRPVKSKLSLLAPYYSNHGLFTSKYIQCGAEGENYIFDFSKGSFAYTELNGFRALKSENSQANLGNFSHVQGLPSMYRDYENSTHKLSISMRSQSATYNFQMSTKNFKDGELKFNEKTLKCEFLEKLERAPHTKDLYLDCGDGKSIVLQHVGKTGGVINLGREDYRELGFLEPNNSNIFKTHFGHPVSYGRSGSVDFYLYIPKDIDRPTLPSQVNLIYSSSQITEANAGRSYATCNVSRY